MHSAFDPLPEAKMAMFFMIIDCFLEEPNLAIFNEGQSAFRNMTNVFWSILSKKHISNDPIFIFLLFFIPLMPFFAASLTI